MAAIDSRELVLNGAIQVLTPALAGLVAAANIHGSWEEAELAGTLGTGPGEQPSFLIVDLGAARPISPQPSTNERTVVLPPGSAASTTIIYADVTQSAPLTITGAAAGLQGQSTAGLIAATVKMTLAGTGGAAGTYTLPLPDDNTSNPPTFAHGLKAQLTQAGDRPHTRDPVRHIYATSVLYTATYADYHTETAQVARQIILRETFTEGLNVVTQTVTRTTP